MPVRELIPELKEKAKKELNEDESRIQEDIQHIKDWLTKQPHLRVRQDDQWILSFLRGCKFSLQRTKEKIDFFYTVREMLPEFFADRDPMKPEIQEILKLGIFIPLKDKDDPLAPSIILLRPGYYDPDKIKLSDMYKTNLMFMDMGLMEEDDTLINGIHIVQDMKNITLGHIATPSFAKKGMTIFQETYPNRPKGIHMFHLPQFFESFFSLFRPFFTEKMKNRMNIYTNGMDELFKVLPQKLFPKEYGGEAGTIEEIAETYKKKLESYREWFLEDAKKYGCDEKKRPGKPKTADELFGMEGSFRALNVD